MSMGGSILTQAKARSSSISVVVTRANGTVEDFGVVSYWHRNPLKRWAKNFTIWIKGRFK